MRHLVSKSDISPPHAHFVSDFSPQTPLHQHQLSTFVLTCGFPKTGLVNQFSKKLFAAAATASLQVEKITAPISICSICTSLSLCPDWYCMQLNVHYYKSNGFTTLDFQKTSETYLRVEIDDVYINNSCRNSFLSLFVRLCVTFLIQVLQGIF